MEASWNGGYPQVMYSIETTMVTLGCFMASETTTHHSSEVTMSLWFTQIDDWLVVKRHPNLKNMSSSIGMMRATQYSWENTKCSKPPTRWLQSSRIRMTKNSAVSHWSCHISGPQVEMICNFFYWWNLSPCLWWVNPNFWWLNHAKFLFLGGFGLIFGSWDMITFYDSCIILYVFNRRNIILIFILLSYQNIYW